LESSASMGRAGVRSTKKAAVWQVGRCGMTMAVLLKGIQLQHQQSIAGIRNAAATAEKSHARGPTVEAMFRYRSWKDIGIQLGRPHYLGCALRRYPGAPMNSSLSFRKESIQRSSQMSQVLNEVPEPQGQRPAREQRPISLTTTLTITQ
jgi:hypothetical protein